MKYLFSIQNLLNNDVKLYSIEAEKETDAEDILAKKAMPLFDISYNTFTRALEEIDLVVTSLGALDTVEEINE